ncbi:hypothetical protein SETIT_9G105100v2 [Setaria italica]|uniref:Uncharacterized protein n=2 Tax=Setaria TaxID=4554 RepID=A0A368SF30_SETIT|nr:hypothetical protein SETIT_9G105100v2 [Setaria italica]RCV41052.1 hypothetical protein SETIT_9G105100v2 [Setaria italica]RCV41053.1 hypothetical protein SETIT_9G105100v2 [Setaria italica]TKV91534.1 hypothetical protein SEVIR_9G102900v2 [Setaria viridis]
MQEAVNPPRPAGQREFRRKSPREAGYPAEKNGLLVRAPVLPAGQAGGAHEYRPAEGGGLLGGDGSSLAAASHQPLPRGKTHRQGKSLAGRAMPTSLPYAFALWLGLLLQFVFIFSVRAMRGFFIFFMRLGESETSTSQPFRYILL